MGHEEAGPGAEFLRGGQSAVCGCRGCECESGRGGYGGGDPAQGWDAGGARYHCVRDGVWFCH